MLEWFVFWLIFSLIGVLTALSQSLKGKGAFVVIFIMPVAVATINIFWHP